MQNVSKNRVIKTETVIDQRTGEILLEKGQFKVATEPDYVKLYLDCMAVFKGLKTGVSPFLLELLNYMTYAKIEDKTGGQLITITKWHRKQIAEKLKISDSLITKNLTQLVKANILKRLDRSVYQANPQVFGRGDWRDIQCLRATFDFVTKEIQLEKQTAEEINDDAIETEKTA